MVTQYLTDSTPGRCDIMGSVCDMMGSVCVLYTWMYYLQVIFGMCIFLNIALLSADVPLSDLN